MKTTIFFQFILIILSYQAAFTQTVTIKRFSIPKEIKNINCITVEKDSIIWMGTNKGLLKIVDSSLTVFFDSKNPSKFKINKILLSDKNEIWLGTYQSSLIKFDNTVLSPEYSFIEKTQNKKILITCVAQNKEKLLISTSDAQLFIFDMASNQFDELSNPSQNSIYSILAENSGCIWLGNTEGLFYYNQNKEWKKEEKFVTSYGIFRKKDEFWAACRNQEGQASLTLLYTRPKAFMRKEQKLWEELALEGFPNKFVRINDICFDKNEFIWIATDEGIVCYNPFDGKGTAIKFEKYSFKIKYVSNIAFQNKNKGIVWFVANGNEVYYIVL